MKLYYLPVIILTLFACNKEAALIPDPITPGYTLPQGNNGYDDTIMTCYKKYGTYILYRFTQSDYAYNYIDKKMDSAFNANPAYIGITLRFLKEQLLDIYPESFLQKTIPYKILLASYIGGVTSRSATGFSSSMSMLAIGWADSTIAQQKPAALKQLRSRLHRYYMERAYRGRSIAIPDAFAALAPAITYARIATDNQYREGILETPGKDLNQATDFLAYIETIIGHTKAQLQAGVFRDAVDSKGLIKRKYEIVTRYFINEFGADLQAIGELP